MFKSLHQEPAKVLAKKILFTPSMAQHTREQMTGAVGDSGISTVIASVYLNRAMGLPPVHIKNT